MAGARGEAGEPFRVIVDPAQTGARNMSIDEALLLHVGPRPCLRLYTWEPACVSLGHRQAPPAWISRARGLGLDVVRRVSGGGAVIHAGDLTYAFVAPRAHPTIPRGVRASYDWIRAALIDGLRGLGLEAEPSRGEPGAERAAVCFDAATGNEVAIGAAKLVGSAQRRTRAGLLQHGSIRLADDSELYRRLFERTLPPVGACLGMRVDTLASALCGAFERALGAPGQPTQLDDGERRTAQLREAWRRASPHEAPVLSLSTPPASADSHA